MELKPIYLGLSSKEGKIILENPTVQSTLVVPRASEDATQTRSALGFGDGWRHRGTLGGEILWGEAGAFIVGEREKRRNSIERGECGVSPVGLLD